ncbi:TEX2 protein, partial [Polypterus senegalus]|nr:TEX2 protein [Polypterus senegalus]
MTSPSSSHAENPGAMSSKPPAMPKLQVQRSLSRETITIHFSAFGKEEEEEEEELYGGSSSSPEELEDQRIVTALEAKEDLLFETSGQFPVDSSTSHSVAALPASSFSSTSSQSLEASEPQVSSSAISGMPVATTKLASTSWPSEHKAVALLSSSGHTRPVVLSSGLSASVAQGSKPLVSLVKSLSTEVEPKEASPSPRHRHLMKTLVKSLSTDTSKQETESVSYRQPDSRLNLHLFKQFTQPRVTSSDSKTAPSSPLTSPSDSRSFFKVPEVEARIEDTKRRLSEVIYEPLQLLSKIMGDEGSSASHKPKALSSSASELTSLASLNGHLESNNNYSIKEEECDSEGECLQVDMEPAAREIPPDLLQEEPLGESKILAASATKDDRNNASSVLEKCSLSALASKEDEEFCELYSEDFELEPEADRLEELPEGKTVSPRESLDVGSEDEEDEAPIQPNVPCRTLFFLIMLVYAYLVLPLPTYLRGLFLGVALGFMTAVGVVWVATLKGTGHQRLAKRRKHPWNTAQLDIKEPGIFKGWMNEIHSYNPETYHATLTHSVFVRLEGNTLRLSKPNKNISRRASFNESRPDVTYVSQKIYDVTDSKIYLLPQNLARKRVWNKKYPICIELGKQDDFMSKAQADRDGAEEGKNEVSADEEKKSLLAHDKSRPSSHKDQTLYLFGRTGREKEEWFRRILLASTLKPKSKKPSSLPGAKSGLVPTHSRSNSHSGVLTHSRNSSKGSLDEVMSQPKQKELVSGVRQKTLLDYSVYMAKYTPVSGSPSGLSPAVLSPVHSSDSSPASPSKLPASQTGKDDSEAWVNALVGRIFWDFLCEKYWSDVVSKKIQMKLSKIRLFCDETDKVTLSGSENIKLKLSCEAWVMEGCGKLEIYEKMNGLWCDLEVSYTGSFLMTLETKMNLTRLGKDLPGEGPRPGDSGREGGRPRTYCLADSDEESSSAGSSDEEDPPEATAGDKPLALGAESYIGGHRASKIMRFVDKITKSKYFQKATETEFIKKKMEEVSNTPLLLTVEVQECQGTLAVNIPPPPTDRIWYGFRSPPHLELKARPKLGEREVTLAHVTDWIEKKLEQEFQKIFVMPNMDDVYIPIMHSAMDPRSAALQDCAKDVGLDAAGPR